MCSITYEVMTDPTVAADGFVYERYAIEEVIKTTRISPRLNTSLTHTTLIPLFELRKEIDAWCAEHSYERTVVASDNSLEPTVAESLYDSINRALDGDDETKVVELLNQHSYESISRTSRMYIFCRSFVRFEGILVAQRLMELGFYPNREPNFNPLTDAIKVQNDSMVTFLIANGISLTKYSYSTNGMFTGSFWGITGVLDLNCITPLIGAAIRDRRDYIQQILEKDPSLLNKRICNYNSARGSYLSDDNLSRNYLNYGMFIMHHLGNFELFQWLVTTYEVDQFFLANCYETAKIYSKTNYVTFLDGVDPELKYIYFKRKMQDNCSIS